MNRIITGIQMEFKSLRLYKWQVLTSLLILPLSYVFVLLLFGGIRGETVTYLISGYMVATLIGSFLGLYAIRICNLMEPQVLELYSTLSVSTFELATSLALSYIILILPSILVSICISAVFSTTVNALFLVLALLISIFTILLIGTFLGLLIKNIFIAQGIIPLLSWVFLLFAPVYYSAENLHPVYTSVLLINPVTHCLSLVRFALGFTPIVNMIWSFIYLTVLITTLSIYILKTFKRIYILERFY